MFLHVGNGRLNLIPHHVDCFSDFLGRTCPLHLKGAGNLYFPEIFMYSLKEIDNGLFFSEHTTQAGFRVTPLKQIDEKRDKEKQDRNQQAQSFWLHRDVHDHSPMLWHSHGRQYWCQVL